ncbi:MAG: hypothetical protein LBJ62_06815 [Bifidobacteriaceae bacterium]|nr:hypothetical protein [Bifidobacteriaceae bacterium]
MKRKLAQAIVLLNTNPVSAVVGIRLKAEARAARRFFRLCALGAIGGLFILGVLISLWVVRDSPGLAGEVLSLTSVVLVALAIQYFPVTLAALVLLILAWIWCRNTVVTYRLTRYLDRISVQLTTPPESATAPTTATDPSIRPAISTDPSIAPADPSASSILPATPPDPAIPFAVTAARQIISSNPPELVFRIMSVSVAFVLIVAGLVWGALAFLLTTSALDCAKSSKCI